MTCLARRFNELDRKELDRKSERTKPEAFDRKKLDSPDQKLGQDYINNLRENSNYPDSLKDVDISKWKKLSPEESKKMRDDFDSRKDDLKHQWEKKNGHQWPKYDQDVYSNKGKLIRRAGSDYDAHHIQPLHMGGKNEVDNITPIHASNHYDRQGIHASDSPYGKIERGII